MSGRHIRRIVGAEIRRRTRAVRKNDHRFGLLLIVAPLSVFAMLVFVGWAYSTGQAVRTGDARSAMALVESVIVWTFTIVVGLTTFRGLQSGTRLAPQDGLLTATRHRDLVTGLLATEFLYAFAFVGIPGVLCGIAFAFGAGSAVTAGLATVTVLSIVSLATGIGTAIALVIRIAIARSRLVARYRIVVGALVLFGYLLTLLYTESTGLFEPVLDVFGASPLTWFGNLASLAVTPSPDPLKAGGISLVTGALVPGLVAVNIRLAALLWYSSSVTPETADSSVSLPSPQWVDRQTRHVVRKTWTRAIRSPLRLVYVGYAGLLVGFVLANAIQHEGSPDWLAPLVALYGGWATGAGMTLNPIGEEGPTLPAMLTSPISGRQYVAGLWVASSIVGVPITLLLTAGVASSSGLALTDLIVVSLFGGGLAAITPGLASGIGTVFPQTETEAITRNREAVVPSFWAFALYSIVLFLLAIPGWTAISSSNTRFASAIPSPSSAIVSSIGTAITLLAVGAVAVLSFRTASARIDSYTP